MNHFSLLAAAGSLFYLWETPLALAESIGLKNGDRFSGKLISLTNGLCIFETHYGSAVSVPLSDIQSISTDTRYNITFANGDKAMGQLKSTSENQTILQSATFGETVIEASGITSLTRFFPDASQEETPVSSEASRYGSEAETQPPLDFLTGSTVLLSPSEYELDLGLAYKQSRIQYGLPTAGYFQKSSYTARQLELRSALRAGLFASVEGYLSVPVTYSHIQDVSSNEYVRSTNELRMADIAFGAQYQILHESTKAPAISFTLDVTAPTGKQRYNDIENRWKDPLNNGSGHWSIAPGLTFVRTTDPAILFGGVSYQYHFPNTIDGYHLQPGWVLRSYIGAGFALNERLSLGSRLSHAYRANLRADHETIQGSHSDPLDLSLIASYRVSDDWVISPEITFGLNDDSGPAAISVNLKRRLN
ncbi:transporter [Pseudomonas gingeri]